MKDVKKFLIAKVKADSGAGGLVSLLGITASEGRIYPSFNPNVVVDATRPGFITYRLLTYGEAGGRVRQPIIRLQIWAIDWDKAEDIRSRLITIFDKKKFTNVIPPTTSNPLLQIVFFKQVYESDVAPEATSSTNLPGKAVDFRVGYEDAGVN